MSQALLKAAESPFIQAGFSSEDADKQARKILLYLENNRQLCERIYGARDDCILAYKVARAYVAAHRMKKRMILRTMT